MMYNHLLGDFYSVRYKAYGPTARGMAWKEEADVIDAYTQMCRLLKTRRDSSILDVGCGAGLGHDPCDTKQYYGCDIHPAPLHYCPFPTAYGSIDAFQDNSVDYVIANGIFNVGYKILTALSVLMEMTRVAGKGVAFTVEPNQGQFFDAPFTLYTRMEWEYMVSEMFSDVKFHNLDTHTQMVIYGGTGKDD